MVSGAGTGGITRGPGSAALTWGEATPDLAEQMKPTSLAPPASVDDAMMLLGTLTSAPNAAPVSAGVQTGAAGPGVSGQAVHQRRLHPRHRQAVAGFFDGDSDR